MNGQNLIPYKKHLSPKDIYLLFDAGGTVLFPNQRLMIELAERANIKFTDNELYHGYYSFIYQLDLRARRDGKFPDDPWPKGYAYSLFECIEKLDPSTIKLAEEIQMQHKKKSLWTFTFPWVYDTLQKLQELGYRMSILSNSDGRVTEVCSELKLDRFFDRIFDSHRMGVSKPNPTIFIQALKELRVHPRQEVFYIGDLHEVDIKGATKAGLRAIHIDPFGKYAHSEWPCAHIETIQDLPEWLERYCDGNVIYPNLSLSQPNDSIWNQGLAYDNVITQPCIPENVYLGVS